MIKFVSFLAIIAFALSASTGRGCPEENAGSDRIGSREK
jgi:hypothetical protein